MRRSPLKEAGFIAESLGFRAGGAVMRALGPDKAGNVSAALWRKLAPLNKRHSRAAGHLGLAFPELSEAQKAIFLNEMWDNLGRTTAESFHIDQLITEQDRFTISPEIYEAIRMSRQRGAVFVSLHQGNWELAAPLLNALGLPVAGVYQKLVNPYVEAIAAEARSKHYPLGLYTKSGDSARRMLSLLSKGGTLTVMADLRDLTGLSVPFFGREAPSTSFPAFAAILRDVPIFAGAVLRVAGSTFKVVVEEVPVTRTGNRNEDMLATTSAIQATLERFIRLAPGQWMWGHKRWGR